MTDPRVESLKTQKSDLCHNAHNALTQVASLLCQMTQIEVTLAQCGVLLCHIWYLTVAVARNNLPSQSRNDTDG